MNCKQCNQIYNNTFNIPQLLPRCGHTVCSACLQQNFASGRYRCFECNVINFAEIVEDFPKNLSLLNMTSPNKTNKGYSEQTRKIGKCDNYSDNFSSIRDDTSTLGNFGVNFFKSDDICLFHKKPVEAFCMDEKMLLCVQCLIDKTHHCHKVVDIVQAYEKVKLNVFKKLNDLDSKNIFISNDFPSKLNGVVSEINQQYRHSVDKIEFQFKELKDMINKRQREVLSELELFNKRRT